MSESALKIDRNEGQHGKDAGGKRELGNVSAQVDGLAEMGEIQHGTALIQLDDDEKCEED
jgi:hypothetical protein